MSSAVALPGNDMMIGIHDSVNKGSTNAGTHALLVFASA